MTHWWPMSRQQDRSRRVARYVIARRKSLGLTHEALADRAELDFKTISSLESGKHWPQLKTQKKVEPALGWMEGDIARIAEGGFPLSGPLPEDDPDGVIAEVLSAGGDSEEFEAKVRAVIDDLPERYRPFVEELYEQWQEAERRNRRLMEKIVPMPVRSERTDATFPHPPDDNGVVGSV